MSKRRRLSIYNVAQVYTPEQQAEKQRILKLKYELGLLTPYYDESKSCKNNDNYLPSMYNSLLEYELDKGIANKLINRNQPILDELREKLIRARKELERRGLYFKDE